VPQEMIISGIFDSGHFDFDGNFVFVHLETGQSLYHLGGDAHGIAVQTTDGFQATKTLKKIDEAIGGEFRLLTWVDMHRTLFEAVAAERQAMYFILLFLMVVAAFCITNTMITVVYQKRTEIGVLKAVGANERQISNVFLIQGIVIGLMGVVTGQILAFIVIENRVVVTDFIGWIFKIDIFSEAQYKIPGGLPAVVVPYDVFMISLGALIACLIASTFPAWMASRLEPAKALRNE
jgi:lipoprotein-releasing system permease protein